MKRRVMTFLWIGAFIVSACATVAKTPISPGDLSLFKGRWEGTRVMNWGKYTSYDFTVMEVYNDTLPLKGELDIAFMEGKDPRTYPFDSGMIDPEGNLVIQLTADIKFTLSLYKGEKTIKLDGNYIHRGNEGRLTLVKK